MSRIGFYDDASIHASLRIASLEAENEQMGSALKLIAAQCCMDLETASDREVLACIEKLAQAALKVLEEG